MRAISFLSAVFLVCAPAWALSLADISNQEAAGGLREALSQGADAAVDALGRPDGFLKNKKVKIPLPSALQRGEKMMRMAGMGKQADELVTTMNRAAEAAVPEARALLVDAVKSMSIDDAKNILIGGEGSVTAFFKEKTAAPLTQKFLPIVREQTARLDLAQMYDQYAGQAARLGLVKQEDAQIDLYVTRKALDGLYAMIAEEEKAIRANPIGAAGGLAKKVFGALGR